MSDRRYEEGCVFCTFAKELPNYILGESEFCYALPDAKPVTKGHTLIITKSHFPDIMSTPDEYLSDALVLAKSMAKKLLVMYPEIKGFNYVSNQGRDAKQVIFHLHIHVIPRY